MESVPPKKKAGKDSRTARKPVTANTNLKRALAEFEASKRKPERTPTAASKAWKTIAIIETLPNWAFDLNGTWEIDASNITRDLF